jgi:uncharacterized protein with HEPN domain
MSPEDRVRVRHMIEACETALNFVVGRQRSDLDSDRMLLFALVRAIEILGEAAGRVSDATRKDAGDIPSNLAAAMRNRLIHEYFDVDREVVWKTTTQELPDLLPRLRARIAEE